MAAFNYVTFAFACPSCGCPANGRVQVHVAADYDGDESGRFMNREYRLGERMAWFSEDDSDPLDWIGFCEKNSNGLYVERSECGCPLCGETRAVEVEFADRVALRILDVTTGQVLAAPTPGDEPGGV